MEEERRDFSLRRLTLEPSVGRPGRRVLGTTWARAISSSSRARAAARLASCVRCSLALMIKTPSRVARFPANVRRRCLTSSGREGDWPISNRSSTAVETLLTFWPPGPEARTKVSVSSESGITIGKCYLQDTLWDHSGIAGGSAARIEFVRLDAAVRTAHQRESSMDRRGRSGPSIEIAVKTPDCESKIEPPH